jgi:C4-dicarboxylate transporter DctM subunit
MLAMFFIGLLALILLGIPISYALGVVALGLVMSTGKLPNMVVVQRAFTGVDSFPLMAIPFFILAGSVMSRGIFSRKLVEFATSCVGHIRGGLGFVGILGSMFFAALSGSAIATSAAIGGMLLPSMEEKGYEKEFSSALIASSSIVGPIIPPSIMMVLYGVSSNTSIATLFLAGIIPGILIGIALMITTYIISVKKNYPFSEKVTGKKKMKALVEALPALFMPIIVLGGIYGGIFTPTEAAVVAVVYAFAIEIFLYREISFKEIFDMFLHSAVNSAIILFIVATAASLSWILTYARIPQTLADTILSVTNNHFVLLLLMQIFLLLVGCIMETNAAVLILTPILVPIMSVAGVDVVHLGIIMIVNLCIGLITPPVGMCLYVTANISKVELGGMIKKVTPFLIAEFAILFLITYVPNIILFLPNIFK